MMINPNDPLAQQVEKQSKIIDALIQRANRQNVVGVSAFQAFQAALELRQKVDAQTRDLEQAAHDLESAHYERERIRRALTGALSSMEECFALFSGGRLDLFNDQFNKVFTELSQVMRSGLRLDAFLGFLWKSEHFVSCDHSLAHFLAFAEDTSDPETTLSAVVELRDDHWYQLNIQHSAPDGLVLLLTEITTLVRRNRAEKASLIARQADYLQAVFQDISSGICTFSADDALMMYNKHFKDLLGLPDEILSAGSRLERMMFHLLRNGRIGFDQVEQIGVWRDEMREQGHLQQRVRFPNDQVFDVQARTLPDGGFVVEIKDVTSEAHNQQLLEDRVRERTTELTRANEQLVQEYDEKARVEEELRLAKEKAEAAVSSKTRFLAAASHDLLQPINAAKLLISTLSQTTRDTPYAAMVERLDGAFGSAEQLLHSLLDLSRLESPGPDTVALAAVPLGPTFESVHADQSVVARQKGVILDMVPTSVLVRSDPVYLLRSVQNLVVNAIQYTPPGGRVLFGCRQRGGQAVLEVWDTGIGIATENQQRIFEEFARLENSPIGSGMGLGLSVVDRACRLLGHRLDVVSQVGRGSVFRIAMERVAGESHAIEASVDWPTVDPGRLEHDDQSALGHIVLVLENDRSVLDSMTLWLEQLGASVLPARTIEEALMLARDIGMPVDVILADYQLDDDCTGLDAIEEIRQLYQQKTPAILITANRDKKLWQKGEAKNISVLTKPVKLASLHALMNRRIRRFRRTEANTMPTKVEDDVDGRRGHALRNGEDLM